jgi:hypothetical protein
VCCVENFTPAAGDSRLADVFPSPEHGASHQFSFTLHKDRHPRAEFPGVDLALAPRQQPFDALVLKVMASIQSAISPRSRSFFQSLSLAFSDTLGFVIAAFRSRILIENLSSVSIREIYYQTER